MHTDSYSRRYTGRHNHGTRIEGVKVRIKWAVGGCSDSQITVVKKREREAMSA